MNILFLHNTFPGPLQHLAAAFGLLPGHTVLFASECGRRDFSLPGVRRVILPRPRDRRPPRQVAAPLDKLDEDMALALQRGRVTASSLQKLRTTGFVPDLLVTTAGVGNSLFARAVFPEAFVVGYGDWYFAEPDAASSPALARLRNWLQLSALMDSHLTYAATQWQRRQYPPVIAEPMRVIPLCVDSATFAPQADVRFVVEGCRLSAADELVTLWGGGLETSRSFATSLKSLPGLLHARPRCRVVILAGLDDRFVQTVLPQLPWSSAADLQRVLVVTHLQAEAYRALLQCSALYVYPVALNRLAPTLLEAMSCGCPVLAGDCEAAREVVHSGENGYLHPPGTPEALTQAVTRLLAAPPPLHLREAARRTILQNHNAASVMNAAATSLLQACTRAGR